MGGERRGEKSRARKVGTKWVKEKRGARKVWQEKWGVKSKARKVGAQSGE